MAVSRWHVGVPAGIDPGVHLAGGRNSGQIALLEGKSGVFLLVRDLAGMKLFRFDPAGNSVGPWREFHRDVAGFIAAEFGGKLGGGDAGRVGGRAADRRDNRGRLSGGEFGGRRGDPRGYLRESSRGSASAGEFADVVGDGGSVGGVSSGGDDAEPRDFLGDGGSGEFPRDDGDVAVPAGADHELRGGSRGSAGESVDGGRGDSRGGGECERQRRVRVGSRGECEVGGKMAGRRRRGGWWTGWCRAKWRARRRR